MAGRGFALPVGGVAVALAVAAAACGGAPAPAPTRGPIDVTAQPAGPDDPVVARVDGRPVYGSCVAAQARGRHLDRAAALAECVDLEVLAGAAVARGLDRDPDVAAARHDAGAVRLLDVAYRARFQRFDDLPASFRDPIFAKNRDRMVRPESRASYFARIEVDRAARPGPVDDAAKRAIDLAYAALAPRSDLFKQDLQPALDAAVAAVDPSLKTTVGLAAPTEQDFGLREYYRRALFSVDAIGRVAAPVASPWGWDMILYTDFRRPPPMTEAEFKAKLFTPARQAYFNQWLDGLARGHAVEVAAPAVLDALWGDLAPAAAPAPPGARR
ncbi:MAG: hypothetical protein R3B06_31590 [Kofleriaceae bacterium]